MERKEAIAHPLKGYHILGNPEQPTMAIIALQTEAGPQLFAVTRPMLEQLAEAFQRHASKMPLKQDQN
jgi:hypothetical protein